MKLRYERGALVDLDEIFAYIAADNREAAGRVVARIERVATRIAASASSTWNALAITAMRQGGGKRVRMSITSPLVQLSPNGWGVGMGKDR